MSEYHLVERGVENTLNYRIFFKNSAGSLISPCQGIPLMSNWNSYNMIVENPRWTNAEMQISPELLNPLKQKVNDRRELQFVRNYFPYKGYIWNYGCFPQSSSRVTVLEIGFRVAQRAEVKKVKILGCLSVRNLNECTIIAVDVTDPDAANLNDIADVETLFPSLIIASIDWFCKQHGTDSQRYEVKDAVFAQGIVRKKHKSWQKSLHSCENVPMSGKTDAKNLDETIEKFVVPEEIDEEIERWHWIHQMQMVVNKL